MVLAKTVRAAARISSLQIEILTGAIRADFVPTWVFANYVPFPAPPSAPLCWRSARYAPPRKAGLSLRRIRGALSRKPVRSVR